MKRGRWTAPLSSWLPLGTAQGRRPRSTWNVPSFSRRARRCARPRSWPHSARHGSRSPCPLKTGPRCAVWTGAAQVPVTGEERLLSRWEILPLLEGGGCSVLQPDVMHAGGITEVKRMALLADTHYVSVAPHNPGGPICNLAAMHLAAAIPNFLVLEEMEEERSLTGQPLHAVRFADGMFEVHGRAGAGNGPVAGRALRARLPAAARSRIVGFTMALSTAGPEKRRVLVTGAYGLIGNILFTRLESRTEVFEPYGMVRRLQPSSRIARPWFPRNRTGEAAGRRPRRLRRGAAGGEEGIDVVVHLAADVDSRSGWDTILQSNIVGTYNIFEAHQLTGVHGSSSRARTRSFSGIDASHSALPAKEPCRSGMTSRRAP